MKDIENSRIQELKISAREQLRLFIKREDELHPFVSGNKFRKLKYNLQEAKRQTKKTLLTFGGAYSNHIAATAYAAKTEGFKSIGVIRGEELVSKVEVNPTLKFAKSCGMDFKFVTREDYRKKNTDSFLEALEITHGDFYFIPEGGTNELAVKGCKEILNESEKDFDFICVCVGTGGTIAGLINSSRSDQKILGFPALKGDFLSRDIRKFAKSKNWELISDYHFGGYGKIKPELITFINQFKTDYNIQLDPIYTGKMMYGIFDLINKNYFAKDAKILVIHTGGLQGIDGMNLKLKQKKLPLIEL